MKKEGMREEEERGGIRDAERKGTAGDFFRTFKDALI